MANVNLTWTPASGSNVTGQVASKRVKGQTAWDTSGFTPANPLSTTQSSASTTISDNTIYEFIVSTNCAQGGPTSTGIVEKIGFQCIAPSLTATLDTVGATINSLPASITKVSFTIHNNVGTLLQGPVVVNVAGGVAQTTFTTLTQSTEYQVRAELIAVVNGAEVTSTCNGIGNQSTITTNAPASCPAPTNLTVDIVNV